MSENCVCIQGLYITCICAQNYSTSPMKVQCPDSECLFAFYGGETVYHKYLIGLQFYNVFLFFWCANFVTALGQMTLAGAFASYYWAFVKPDDMPAFPVFSALGRSLRWVCVEDASVHLTPNYLLIFVYPFTTISRLSFS